jgi:ketosteroid isomerase-like protein
VYLMLVRRRTARMFEALARGDAQPFLASAAEDVHYAFPGDHALGGERRTREAVARWFERLHRLFPGHAFEVDRILARGWPWSTWVVVAWSARMTPQAGEPYLQRGTHWIHIRWGRAVSLRAYLDTHLVVTALDAMAECGVEEAGAAPIVA